MRVCGSRGPSHVRSCLAVVVERSGDRGSGEEEGTHVRAGPCALVGEGRGEPKFLRREPLYILL